MSKNRRFYLRHNNQSIRTIDELREYCTIEQLLIDYREGKLQRWLKALRCFGDTIDEINCLSVENDLEIAQELVRILEIKEQAFEDYQAKFLIYNNQYVRTIDELREHCSVEQLLIDYREGKLQNWLKALRCFDDIITKMDCLSVANDLELAQKLVNILSIERQLFLIHQNQLIKNLHDLRKHYTIEQLLIDYHNDSLKKWLQSLPHSDNLIFEIDKLSEKELEFPELIENTFKILSINIPISHSILYGDRGLQNYKNKNYLRAISDFNQAIIIDPNNFNAYNNRGFCYYILQQKQEAMDDFTKAIELNPKYAEAFHNRASLYSDLEEYEKAIIDYDQAITMNSKKQAFYKYKRQLIYNKTNNNTSTVVFLALPASVLKQEE